MNNLWDLNLSDQILLDIGSRLGADVPIFIYGQSAWAEGIGEQLTPIEVAESEFILINPGIHISTKTIFESEFLPRNSPLMTDRYFDTSRAINDCLPAIYHHYPQMRLIMNALFEIGLDPYITGTGSCIFVSKPSAEKQLLLNTLADREKWELLAFTSKNRSMLYEDSPIQLRPDTDIA